MSLLRPSETIRWGMKTRQRFHLLIFAVALPRLTARRAATIEPTIQEPISKVTALNNTSPSNSTALSICRPLLLYLRLPEAPCIQRLGAQIAMEPGVLKSSQLSERRFMPPQRTQ